MEKKVKFNNLPLQKGDVEKTSGSELEEQLNVAHSSDWEMETSNEYASSAVVPKEIASLDGRLENFGVKEWSMEVQQDDETMRRQLDVLKLSLERKVADKAYAGAASVQAEVDKIMQLLIQNWILGQVCFPAR